MTLIGNRYRILDEIGAGGMGRVLRTEDRLTGEIVALKQVNVSTTDLSFRSRSDYGDYRLALAQEFRTLAALRHPHIISVLDYGFHDEQPFFTMELLTAAKPFHTVESGFEERVTHTIQMLQALAYLHRQGVLHRDLKPENVLITSEGEVKVLDFGLALVARRQADTVGEGTAGTLAYLAPELLKDGTPSPASDLYAAGLVAYRAFTGVHPFETDKVATTIIRIMNENPNLEPLDSRLRPVIGRLLSKAPGLRYQDAFSTIKALSTALDREVPETAALRESYLQGARFVGREAEIKTLAAAVAKAREGEGSLWLIGGESGVGKSRLLEEVRIQALVHGYDVIRGQAVAEGGRAYELWRDPARWFALSPDLTPSEAGILQQIVLDIAEITGSPVAPPPELSATASRQRLARTLADLITRQGRPLLILLEDLHWTQESLDLTADIARAGIPAVIIGTYRNDEAPTLPERLPMAETITLDRLDQGAIAELSRTMVGDADEKLVKFLAEQTEGNVFFIVEVMRSLTQDAGGLGKVSAMDLPETVAAEGIERVIERRINRIPEELRPILRTAAVAGRRIDRDLMETLYAEMPTLDWLMRAESVLEVQEGRWRFAHDKLREGILARIPASDLPQIHRRVAEGIEKLYGAEQAISLAEHWHIAEDSAKELTYAHLAAQQMLNVHDINGAEEMAQRALSLLESGQDALHGDLLHIIAQVQSIRGSYEQAVDTLKKALRLVTEPGKKAEILIDQMEAHIRQTQFTEADALGPQAVTFAQEADNRITEGHALLQRAQSKWMQSEYDEAETYARQAMPIAEEEANKRMMATALSTLATIISRRGDPPKAVALQQRALVLNQDIGDRRGTAIMLNNLGVTARKMGQLTKSVEYYSRAAPIFKEIGFLWGVTAVVGNRGHVERQLGRYDAARHSHLTALEGSLSFNALYSILQALAGLADCYLEAGDGEHAARLAGLVRAHEYYDDDVAIVLEPVLEKLQERLPADDLATLMKKGEGQQLTEAAETELQTAKATP